MDSKSKKFEKFMDLKSPIAVQATIHVVRAFEGIRF
jgi:hypothetical protein